MLLWSLVFRFCSGSCRHARLLSRCRKTTTTRRSRRKVRRPLLLILRQFFNLKHSNNYGKRF
nr:MAG TPA: hypothetical protein [Microviridae sp.]